MRLALLYLFTIASFTAVLGTAIEPLGSPAKRYQCPDTGNPCQHRRDCCSTHCVNYACLVSRYKKPCLSDAEPILT